MLCKITLIGYLIFFIGSTQVSSQDSSEVADRIFNGRDVKPGERPYQVSLQNPKHFCGGSIVSRRHILTAAHCLVGQKASSITILAGTINLRKPFKIYRASKLIINRGYNRANSFKNDIALIQVSEPITFSQRVKALPIIAPHVQLRPGTPVIVSGWGRLLNGTIANILQEVLLEVTDQEKCRQAVKSKGFNLYNSQMCADDNDPSLRSGDCNGDSGGPLTYNDALVGIVSWSIKDPICGSNKYPNIYTRVSEFVDWILENVKNRR